MKRKRSLSPSPSTSKVLEKVMDRLDRLEGKKHRRNTDSRRRGRRDPSPSPSTSSGSSRSEPPIRSATRRIRRISSSELSEDGEIGSSSPADVAGSCLPPSLDESVRSLLGRPSDTGVSLAEPIHQDIAAIWESLAHNGVDPKTREELLAKYSPPANARFVQPPTVNPEVKASIKLSSSDASLRRDDRLATIQGQIGTCLAAIGEALTICLTQKAVGTNHQLIEILGDAGRLLADIHHSESISRRNILSFGLNKTFKETMDDSPIDEWLFGEKCADKLQTAKSLEKSGADLRATLRKPLERREPRKPEKPLNVYRPSRRTYRPPPRDGRKYIQRRSGAKLRPRQRSPLWKSRGQERFRHQ